MSAVEEQHRSSAARRARAQGPAPASTADSHGNGEHLDDPGRLRVRRFDADRRDRKISLAEALESSPSHRQLLWIDVAGDIDAGELEALGKRFRFDAETRRALETPVDQPHLAIHGTYFHLSAAAEPGSAAERPKWLHLAASENVVVTRHADRLALLDDIDARIKADTTLGAIVGAEFVATLLDEVVTSYFAAVDEIEDAIDEIDTRSLKDDGRHDVLDALVRLRQRIARLRRVLTSHRSLFSALSGPDMRQLVGADPAADLQPVSSRFESAVAAVEASRSALLGSFDVYMTKTAQRTNEVMKVLTIATVLLLPGSVIAGLLGMNVIVPLDKDNPMSFWFVLAGVGILAVVVIATARWKRWI